MDLQEALQDKKAWRALQKRAKLLPQDYYIVYQEIQKYLFKIAPLTLSKDTSLFHDLIDLFEAGAKEQKDVLEVTGTDVAAFADAFLEGYDIKEDLQKDITNQTEASMQKWLDKN